jgi:hypothetical protein
MAKDIQTIDNDNDNLGPVPEIFKNRTIDTSDFTSGLQPSFPVVNIRGGRWGIRFGGQTTQFTEADPRAGGAQTPVTHLDVIIAAAQTGISKSYYEGDFDPNSTEPPTCWSADGIRPDDTVQKKQNPVCGTCKQNERGSKTVGDKKLKACTDIKRVAVVRQEEIDNPLGPILLRVMPGSQSNYRTYVQWLAGRHRAPFMVVTRMTFDTEESFPKIKFQALRGLTEKEAAEVEQVLDHPMLNSVLVGKDQAAFIDPEQDEQDPAGGLPPTGGLPPADTPAKPGWEKTATVVKSTPEPERKVTSYVAQPMNLKPDALEILAAEKQELARLRAENEALKAKPEPEAKPEPKPEPKPVLTPEQMELAKLRAENEALKQGKPRGRPRSKPVGPPTGSVTTPSNGSGEAETSAGKLSNDLDSMIDKLAPKAP